MLEKIRAQRPEAPFLAVTLVTGLLLSTPTQAGPPQGEAMQLDIRQQKLIPALTDFAQQTGVQLLYSAELAENLVARPVKGLYTPTDALEALLKGSGIHYRYVGDNVITLEWPTQSSFTMESLLAAAGEFKLTEGAPGEAPHTGPVEQEDLTVTGGDWNSYNVLNASTATRTDTPILETPLSIHVVPRRVLDDQQIITVEEALRNVSGVVPRAQFITPNFEPTLIRGFSAQQHIDGFTQYRNAGDQGSLVNVERIEVVKGANAVLYGGGNGSPVGGIVNVISKLPKPQAFYEVGVKGGLYEFAQPYVDLNQPITDNILFRFTGEYTTNESHIDVLETERFNLNPTLTLTDNDATTFTLQGKFSRWEQQDYQGLPAVGTVAGNFDIKRDLFIGPKNIDKSDSEFYGVWGTLDHRLNDTWSLTAKARYSHSEFDTLAQNIFGSDGFGANEPFFPPSTWALLNSELAQEQEEKSFQVYATAKFDLGPTQNTVLLGGDYSELDDDGFMDFAILPAVVDLAAPVFSLPYSFPGERRFNQFTKNTTYGGYVQLQSTIYDRLHLLAAFRGGNVTTEFKNTMSGYKSKADTVRFLPNVGALIDITDEVSVYANYSEGMRGQGGVNFVSSPEPELSNQIEVGIKFDVADQLTGQIAAFEIERENVAVTDVTDSQLRSIAKGQQRSRGIETDITWEATEGLTLMGSYAFTEAEFTDSLAGVPEGNDLPGVPKHSGRFWANYAFNDSILRGWSLGAGIYAQSSAYVSKENVYKSDSYYTMDATLSYKAKNYTLGLSVKNLTDQDYYQWLNYFGSRVQPAQGTTGYLSAAVRF